MPAMEPEAKRFDREWMRVQAAALAERGVYLGTSSWKYAGWRGMLYDESRYLYRGRFVESRFERNCLPEYAEVFKTVCVDAAYYRFPDRKFLDGLVSQVPADFLFTMKVSDEITVKRFSNLPRFGKRAGTENENFLNADLFQNGFLRPCEEFKKIIGVLMFEFSRFYPSDFARGRDFVETLDKFLTALPKGWRYGVEIRNNTFLAPEYFEMLARHGVAHVFNSWDAMPPVQEQWAMPGSRTADDFFAARFLLKPGRKYQEAVDLFSPYTAAKEPSPEARAVGGKMISETVNSKKPVKGFFYINNRLEGNALETLMAMIEHSGVAVPS